MDTWDVNDEEFEAVLGQSADQQFDYFVHKVAEAGAVWLLAKPGNELAVIEGEPVGLAVWPHERFAEPCRVRGWSDYEPAFVEVDHFIEVTLGEAEEKGHVIALLHSAETRLSVTIGPAELREALMAERAKY